MNIYRKLQYDPTKGEPAMKIEEKINEFWDAGFSDGIKDMSEGKKYQFKRDMKAKQGEADVYSVCGICICVCLWMYLALTIFPKG